MTDQSGSHLRVLFEAALEDYKQQTGIELPKHPLAKKLQYYNAVSDLRTAEDLMMTEDLTGILCQQAQNFRGFREKDRVFKPLKKVLTVLRRLRSAADFTQGVGLVCP